MEVDNLEATVARIKVEKSARTKTRAPRNPLFLDEKYFGPEPVWDTAAAMELTDAEFDVRLRNSFRYYNYFYSNRELRPEFNSWLAASNLVDADTLRAYLKSPDSLTPITVAALVRAHRKGMPMRDRFRDHIKNTVLSIVNREALGTAVAETEKEKPKAAVKQPTIQDRLREIAEGHIAHIESFEDQLESDAVTFDAYGYFHEKTVTQGAVVAVSKFFQPHFEEISAAAAGEDEQLKEGYRKWPKVRFKRYIAFYTALFADIEKYQQHKTVVRKPRVKRAPSKEKLVARVKYMKQDAALKLTSINPADIVGAGQLWVFNTRTRKLGVYVADSLQGPLSIKGTSIVGFDEAASVNKTVRKPADALRDFFKATKPALKKFLSTIKSTESKMTGRLNEDTVLLKVL
jgi:hypothetical protein